MTGPIAYVALIFGLFCVAAANYMFNHGRPGVAMGLAVTAVVVGGAGAVALFGSAL